VGAKGAMAVLAAGVVLMAGAVSLAVTQMREDDVFPWGIHLITIPAVFLLGLVAGWVMRERQAADERARAEIEGGNG
jgi:type III secretory pathway component EscS